MHTILSRRALLTFVLASMSIACSLFISPPEVQCTNTADCVARGGIFTNRQCREGLCVAPQDIGTTGCVSNSKCVEDNNGLPFTCVAPNTGAACVPILSEDCTDVRGPYDDDNALLLGHFTLLSGAQAVYGKEDIEVLMLAFNEIQRFGGGVPVNGQRRPIALVSCAWDNIGRAGAHLTEQLKVPAVLGLNDPEKLTEFTSKFVREKKVFVMTPDGSPVNDTLPDDGLVWRNRLGLEDMAFMPLFATELEPQIKAERSKTEIKIAILVWDFNTETLGFASALTQDFKFNGTDVATNEAAGRFKRINHSIINSLDEAFPIATQLASFKPDIIIGYNYSDLPMFFFSAIEQSWPLGEPRPYYIGAALAEPGTGNEETVGAIEEAGAGIVARIRGWSFPPPKTALWATFGDAYRNLLQAEPRPFHARYYEQAYLTSYAIAAAGNVSVLTGTAIAEGIQRFSQPGGTPFVIGPGDGTEINKIFTTVPFTNASFTGPTGPITFNQQGDRRPEDFEIESICFRKIDGKWKVGDGGQTVDRTTRKIVGTHTCP